VMVTDRRAVTELNQHPDRLVIRTLWPPRLAASAAGQGDGWPDARQVAALQEVGWSRDPRRPAQWNAHLPWPPRRADVVQRARLLTRTWHRIWGVGSPDLLVGRTHHLEMVDAQDGEDGGADAVFPFLRRTDRPDQLDTVARWSLSPWPNRVGVPS
jgi:hypothetical protein